MLISQVIGSLAALCIIGGGLFLLAQITIVLFDDHQYGALLLIYGIILAGVATFLSK